MELLVGAVVARTKGAAACCGRPRGLQASGTTTQGAPWSGIASQGMRRPVYLLSLLIAAGGSIYFASQGNTVGAVLAVMPGYFVVAYVLILVSTFLPGEEKQRFQQAKAAAFPAVDLPPETPMHPAFMGSIMEGLFSGDGFLGWPEGGDLFFRATVHPPATFQYPTNAFRGFKLDVAVPSFIDKGSSVVAADGGPLVLLDGGSAAGMARLWVQPDDAESFVGRLRAAGMPALD